MTIQARHSSVCDRCEGQIHPGDLIRWEDESWAHVACPDPSALTVDRAPCPRCFTVPAVNGECGCVG